MNYFRIMFLFFLFGIVVVASDGDHLQTENKTYLYFGYGSNLLSARIHINTNAQRVGIGKLKHYRLDFELYTKTWQGAVATIVPDNNHEVWGALWNITQNDLDNLDRQEGVEEKMYFRFFTNVEQPDGTLVNCLTYQLVNNPDVYVPLNEIPETRQPSKGYINTIIKGAEESGLPIKYREMLNTITHNEFEGNIFRV